MDSYGTATIQRDQDGTLRVLDADPVIGISLELLARAEDGALPVDTDGLIWLAGDPRYRYRPVRFDAAGHPVSTARVLVCERVEG